MHVQDFSGWKSRWAILVSYCYVTKEPKAQRLETVVIYYRSSLMLCVCWKVADLSQPCSVFTRLAHESPCWPGALFWAWLEHLRWNISVPHTSHPPPGILGLLFFFLGQNMSFWRGQKHQRTSRNTYSFLKPRLRTGIASLLPYFVIWSHYTVKLRVEGWRNVLCFFCRENRKVIWQSVDTRMQRIWPLM